MYPILCSAINTSGANTVSFALGFIKIQDEDGNVCFESWLMLSFGARNQVLFATLLSSIVTSFLRIEPDFRWIPTTLMAPRKHSFPGASVPFTQWAPGSCGRGWQANRLRHFDHQNCRDPGDPGNLLFSRYLVAEGAQTVRMYKSYRTLSNNANCTKCSATARRVSVDPALIPCCLCSSFTNERQSTLREPKFGAKPLLMFQPQWTQQSVNSLVNSIVHF